MKKLASFITVIIILLGLSACDALNIKIDTTMDAYLDIEVQDDSKSSAISYDFYAEKEINPLDDEEVQKYIENITDWEVKSFIATVDYVSKANIIFYQGTYFQVKDNEDIALWTLDEDLTLVELAEVVLDDIDGQWETMRTILKKNKPYKVTMGGTCSDNNVFVTFLMKVGATVTANPL